MTGRPLMSVPGQSETSFTYASSHLATTQQFGEPSLTPTMSGMIPPPTLMIAERCRPLTKLPVSTEMNFPGPKRQLRPMSFRQGTFSYTRCEMQDTPQLMADCGFDGTFKVASIPPLQSQSFQW